MDTSLTLQESQCLRYIQSYIRVWREAPLVSDVGEALNISANHASVLIHRLKRKGRLIRSKGPRRQHIALVPNSWMLFPEMQRAS